MTTPTAIAVAGAALLPRWDKPHDHAAYALILGRRYPQLDAQTAVQLDQMQCEVCGLTYEIVIGVRRTDPVDWPPATWDRASFLGFVAFLAERVGACELCCHRTNCRYARQDADPCPCRCHRLDDRGGR